MTQKTIKEWLETLDEPYKSQALKNLDPSMTDSPAPSISIALIHAFPWSKSPEGDDYWTGVLLTQTS